MIAAFIPEEEKRRKRKTMELLVLCAIFTGKDFSNKFRWR
jgi:hypothetical protein